MKGNWANVLAFILHSEGGFVDDPDDSGGPTNQGITLGTYQKSHPGATVEDLKKITPTEVSRIYETEYWDTVHGGDLPVGVDLMVADFGVTSRPSRSVTFLQSAVGTSGDGIIGPLTMAAIASRRPIDIVITLASLQRAYYRGLKNPKYEKGWLNRTDARVAFAETMVKAVTPPLPVSPTPPVPPAAAAVSDKAETLARLLIRKSVITAAEWSTAATAA